MGKTPSADDLRLAALWLKNYEANDSERAPFMRVAHWLDQQADAQILRDVAKEKGIPVAKLRAMLVRNEAKAATL